MDIASLLVFGTALFVAAAMPGPGIAAIVARVLSRGIGGAAAFTFGVGLGDLVWLALGVGGLAVLAQTFHWLFLAIKWAGIAYLVWMALKMWRAPVAHDASRLPQTESPGALVLAGLSLTMGNPKVMMFYLALLPSIVDLRAVDLAAYLQLSAVVACVLALVFSGYMALAGLARRMLNAPGRLRAVNRGSSLTMVGAAGWLATR